MSNTKTAAATVNLTIDGKRVTAAAGTSILDAAASAGIEIPHLCYVEELPVYGSCRLCLVQIKQGRGTRLVVSCAFPIEEGLEVETDNPRIAKHRKVILELLSARWDHLPEALLEKYGADPNRFEDSKNTTYCILCGLCIRHCAEVVGANVLGFVGRGTERQVVIYPELAKLHCPTCGMQCLDVCPTGVISSEFSVQGLAPKGKQPIAYPVCIRDDDNTREVAAMVGDRD